MTVPSWSLSVPISSLLAFALACGGPAPGGAGVTEAGLAGSALTCQRGAPASGFEPLGRIRGREHRGPLVRHVAHRRGLAVIADFSNARLEDWQGAGIRSVAQLQDQLVRMEEHWSWLSRGLERFHWDILRVTLPVDLRADAYPSWLEYREAVAGLVRQRVEVSRYDANRDGIIDTVWVIASDNGQGYDFMMGGASQPAGANMFVDGQDSVSLVSGATGNFNHETGHTIGLPDLYGPYGTIVYLSVMADPWPVPPNDFTAYERTVLGWLRPQVVTRGRSHHQLARPDGRMEALLIPTSRPSEYFLIEHRRRPAAGFGSTVPIPYDGLTVLHVLESSNQAVDPPLLKLEPADGSSTPDAAPDLTDFLYPENPSLQRPFVARSYFDGQEVFRLDALEWTRQGGLAFDLRVAPRHLSETNLLANAAFEAGTGAWPEAWLPDAFDPSAAFAWDTRVAVDGGRSVSISSATPNDARWVQAVSGLTPGRGYALCGWLRGEAIATAPDARIGANLSLMGDFIHSEPQSGTFGWTQSCVAFRAPAASVEAACRLGFYGSTVTGKAWCDQMTLEPLLGAF